MEFQWHWQLLSAEISIIRTKNTGMPRYYAISLYTPLTTTLFWIVPKNTQSKLLPSLISYFALMKETQCKLLPSIISYFTLMKRNSCKLCALIDKLFLWLLQQACTSRHAPAGVHQQACTSRRVPAKDHDTIPMEQMFQIEKMTTVVILFHMNYNT